MSDFIIEVFIFKIITIFIVILAVSNVYGIIIVEISKSELMDGVLGSSIVVFLIYELAKTLNKRKVMAVSISDSLKNRIE